MRNRSLTAVALIAAMTFVAGCNILGGSSTPTPHNRCQPNARSASAAASGHPPAAAASASTAPSAATGSVAPASPSAAPASSAPSSPSASRSPPPLRRPSLGTPSLVRRFGHRPRRLRGSSSSPAAGRRSPASITPECQAANLTTKTPGTLTVNTDNPAFAPWFGGTVPAGSTGPTSAATRRPGQGFESAIAYGIASELGFTDDQVTWTANANFNDAFKPGHKDYDFHLAQDSYQAQARRVRSTSARATTTSPRPSSPPPAARSRVRPRWPIWRSTSSASRKARPASTRSSS